MNLLDVVLFLPLAVVGVRSAMAVGGGVKRDAKRGAT